jgi:hypothetical protein
MPVVAPVVSASAHPARPVTKIAAGEHDVGTRFGRAEPLRGLPPRRATLPAFEVDAAEVSVAEYGACVTAGTCKAPSLGTDPLCNWNVPGKESHPINCVSFDDAVRFCAWDGKRLPSEEEWEAAALTVATVTSSSVRTRLRLAMVFDYNPARSQRRTFASPQTIRASSRPVARTRATASERARSIERAGLASRSTIWSATCRNGPQAPSAQPALPTARSTCCEGQRGWETCTRTTVDSAGVDRVSAKRTRGGDAPRRSDFDARDENVDGGAARRVRW